MANYTELTEAKARLVDRTKTLSIAGDSLTRSWEKIDATVADTLVSAVTGSTVTNPEADGQTYTGTFARNTITAKGQDDRSVIVLEDLTLINTVTATIGTLQALSPTKTYDNEILNNWGINEGELDTVLWQYKNMNPSDAQRIICLGYSDSDIEATLGLAAGSYQKRRFDIQEDNTATFTIASEEPTWSSASWATQKKEMQESNSNGHRVARQTTATGLDNAAGNTAYAAAKADTTEVTRTVLMARLTELANGERVVDQTKGEISESTDTAEMVVIQVQSPVGRREAAVGRVWWNRSEAAKEALIKPTATIGEAAKDFSYNSVTYTHAKVEVTDQGNGRYNVMQLGVIPKDTSTGFRGFKDGVEAPFSYRATVSEDNVGTVKNYVVIIDRIVTDTQATARDFVEDVPAGTNVHPKYLYRLGSVNWDDRNQRYIGLKETWWVAGGTPPTGLNNDFTPITATVPTRAT
jgi:hypothetical protein